MVFERFALSLIVRLAGLFACLTGLVLILTETDFVAAPVLLILLTIGLVWNILSYVRRTNKELARFLDAVRNADFSQKFNLGTLGTGFEDLGAALEQLMGRLRANRVAHETELRRLRALVDHSPVALMTVTAGGETALLNNAARRLFDVPEIKRLEDLIPYGSGLPDTISKSRPGETRLVDFRHGDRREKLSISVADLSLSSGQLRLVSLQNILTQLEATELEAWQSLVRVLTHEIMNSITPISSLARTATDLVDRAKGEENPVAALDDIRQAVDTVARRSDGLTHFVQSYRQLTRLPPPQLETVRLTDFFDRLKPLLESDLAKTGAQLHIGVTPVGLQCNADPQQLEQVIINLVRNSLEACASDPPPRIHMQAAISESGRPMVQVDDNGPGIDPSIGEQVFIPFFTTKRTGSGVGLALTRQIMLAHGGTVRLGRSALGGTRITLLF